MNNNNSLIFIAYSRQLSFLQLFNVKINKNMELVNNLLTDNSLIWCLLS